MDRPFGAAVLFKVPTALHCTATSSLLFIYLCIVSNYGFRLRFLYLHVFVSVATFLPVFPKLVLQPYRFLIENSLPLLLKFTD